MFEAIRSNKRIAQVILGLLIIPFAAFGLDAYFGDGLSGGEVAKVGGSSIYQAEFDKTLREQQDRLRAELGDQVTPAMLESEELRKAVLDRLVMRRALSLYARDMRLTAAPELLQQTITQIEAFQENGRFSRGRYQGLLSQQGMSPAGFERELAQDIIAQQLLDAVGSPSLVARSSARRLLAAQLEERVVREMRFPVGPHLGKIVIDEAAIQKFYEDNQARFALPERLKAEYVVFGKAALHDTVQVSDEEIKQIYATEEYVQPEARRVRHILIETAFDADEAMEATVRKEAEEIAALLRTAPDRFPELVQEKSQDTGTKESGGDLGYITRDGSIEAEFEKAAFSLKQDQISDPVRTGYGYHIIQVTAIRAGGEKLPLADVRDEIVAKLREQKAEQQFADGAEKFSEMVFNQEPDSLKPAAEAFGLQIQQTDWISRGQGVVGDYPSEDLLADLFADDAVRQHHNTRAVEVAPNTLVAARVLEHEAARRLPLDEVRGQIEAQLRREEAARLAREEGRAVLAAIEQGEAPGKAWSEPRSYQRAKADLPPAAARAVFSAPVTNLPVRVGAELVDDAYVLYQIDAVEHPDIDDGDSRIATMASHYGTLQVQRDTDAFLTALRQRYAVEIKLPPSRKETE